MKMKDIKTYLFGFLILFLNCSGQNAIKYLNSGESKRNRGDFKEAIIDYDKAIEINSTFEDAYLDRGLAKADLKDYMGAMEDYNKAIDIYPNFALAYLNRGNLKCDLKDYYGALEDCNKALGIDPNLGITFNSRGIIKYHLEDFQGALMDYNKAIESNFDQAFAYFNRGLVNYKLQDIENACKDWRKAGDMGVKEAYDKISRYCNQRRNSSNVHFECSGSNDITFRNPEYVSTLDGEEELLNISIVNRTSVKIMMVTVKYRCLDSSGTETDSGDFEFDGNMHPLMGPNSTKRKSVGLKFPAEGKIIFEVESYKAWPCPTDEPC